MSTWTPEDLRTLGDASEIRIATLRADGTARRALPVWVVRVGDDLYVRSYNGAGGSWFQQVTRHPYARIAAGGVQADVRLTPAPLADHVDEAYWAKYGRGGYGTAMTTARAQATTLLLTPADSAD